MFYVQTLLLKLHLFDNELTTEHNTEHKFLKVFYLFVEYLEHLMWNFRTFCYFLKRDNIGWFKTINYKLNTSEEYFYLWINDYELGSLGI